MNESPEHDKIVAGARAALAEVGGRPEQAMLDEERLALQWFAGDIARGDMNGYRACLLAAHAAYGSAKLVPCPSCAAIPYSEACVTIAEAIAGSEACVTIAEAIAGSEACVTIAEAIAGRSCRRVA